MKSLLMLALSVALASVAYAQNWPSFRGQNSAGVADGNDPRPSFADGLRVQRVLDAVARSATEAAGWVAADSGKPVAASPPV